MEAKTSQINRAEEVEFEISDKDKQKLKEYMEFSLRPNFKVAGSILGSKIKLLGKALAELDGAVAVKQKETLAESIERVKDDSFEHWLIFFFCKVGVQICRWHIL